MGDAPIPPDDFDAAFEATAARLRAAVAEACARPGPWPGRVGAAIEAALALAAEDPATARLLLIEPWRRGGEALRAHDRLLEHFADLLAAGRGEAPGGEELPAISERFLLAALASILARRLAPKGEDGPAATPGLATELTEFVLAPYLGHARAAVWARLRPAPRPRLSSDAELLQPVEFTEVLARLQGVIGSEAQVVVNLPGHFFDCGFHARLERVETLSGKDGPVLLAFAGAQGVALDPDEFDCFLARWPGGMGYAWLELRLGDRLHLVIEPLSDPE
jgi:hypothetical protein